MLVITIAVLVIVALACIVLAVVAVGVGGRYTEKSPKFTGFAEEAVKHLNGEAEPPQKITELLNR